MHALLLTLLSSYLQCDAAPTGYHSRPAEVRAVQCNEGVINSRSD